MFSIKGTFKDNKIQLSEPLKLQGRTNVIITFLNSDGEEESIEAEVIQNEVPEADVMLDDEMEETALSLDEEDELDDEVSLDFEDDINLEDGDENFEDDMLVDEDDRELVDTDLETEDEALEYDLSGDDGLILEDDDEFENDDIMDLDADDDDELEGGLDLTASVEDDFDDEFSEKDYSKIRKHKRYKAKGQISLLEDDEELVYPLFDYSAGGLSFISERSFNVKKSLTASIKDPIDQDSSVLDFEFEVVRVVKKDDKFKIGCKFFDEVDEEIWHSLMS